MEQAERDALERACSFARLNEIERRAAIEAADGLGFRQIATALDLPYKVVRRAVIRSATKLRERHSLRQSGGKWLRDVLICHRNVGRAGAGGGGALQRAKALGAVASDFETEGDLAFLRRLPRLLLAD